MNKYPVVITRISTGNITSKSSLEIPGENKKEVLSIITNSMLPDSEDLKSINIEFTEGMVNLVPDKIMNMSDSANPSDCDKCKINEGIGDSD